MEDNVPPFHWPRARIEELYLGNDKIAARVAKVFSGKSSFIRPLSKLRLLPPIQSLEAALMNIERGGPDPTIHADAVSTYTIKHRPPDSTTHHC